MSTNSSPDVGPEPMEKHVTAVAVLHIALSSLNLLAAIIVFLAVVGGGIISGDQEAMIITTGVGSAIALILILLSAPGIIGGIALLKWQSWARYLVLALGFVNLLHIPLGTILGVYTIWALMKDETVTLFRREPQPASQN